MCRRTTLLPWLVIQPRKNRFSMCCPVPTRLTFGMLGCDLHCAYCQNWLTSQALRDDSAGTSPTMVSAERLVTMAKAYGAQMIGSSYNEPLITAEWAVDVFKKAKPAGFRTAFISNGNATPQVLDYLRPWTDCYKIDLKSMNDKNYRQLGGVVDNILETVKMVHERGFWEEIVTLVIPGFNDSEDELRRAADFIASVSPDIPWHVTAFHQDYKMTENSNTTAAQLMRACEIGREAGLNYIYAGNLPGRVGRWENTYCPSCDELLVERFGYLIRQVNVTSEGRCPNLLHHDPWHLEIKSVFNPRSSAAKNSPRFRDSELCRSRDLSRLRSYHLPPTITFRVDIQEPILTTDIDRLLRIWIFVFSILDAAAPGDECCIRVDHRHL